MIEKLKLDNGYKIIDWLRTSDGRCGAIEIEEKINELVDAVNELQKDREEIKEWIGIVSDLRSRVPVVESRVSILEEHAHPTAITEPTDPTNTTIAVILGKNSKVIKITR